MKRRRLPLLLGPLLSTGSGLDRLSGASGDNILLIKLSYWWNP